MKHYQLMHLLTGMIVVSLVVGCASTPPVSSEKLEDELAHAAAACGCCPDHDTSDDEGESASSQTGSVITIAADGRIAMNNQTMDLDRITQTLKQGGIPTNAMIIIATHPQAPFEKVTRLAAHIRGAGYEHLSVQVGE